ncbi:unnamed protein product [Kuraishia capsulata CBS 1993]|uniref:Uncharacterized protein n=1 Tax=Kuraishia capsulata CBS 1993 TaxID=1382522 RepID=W6MLP2_9ASCO|nr:uncharacterized protein KUCA_T00001747001 [Kuraishia capsulata CBS 1993]CDK25777.1 unnamed protein product [Kuraishia capsulata CBS 1993]
MVLYDAHCHLSPFVKTETVARLCENLNNIYGGHDSRDFNLMSTNKWDLEYVSEIASKTKVVMPCFGIHPWYSHLFTDKDYSSFSDPEEIKRVHYNNILTGSEVPQDLLDVLPVPEYFPKQLERIREVVLKHSQFMIGEIGLDKLFRVPWTGYLGHDVKVSDKGTSFTKCYVKMTHQKYIFVELLLLAVELNVPVSVHCVKAHGLLFDTVKEHCGDKIKISLHSYSGSVDQANQWRKMFPNRVYFSLSKAINLDGTRDPNSDDDKKYTKFHQIVDSMSKDTLLMETDMSLDTYYCGDEETTPNQLLHQSDLEVMQKALETRLGTDADLLANWRRFLE